MSKHRATIKQKGKEPAHELLDVTAVEIDDENWECLICFLMEVDMDSVPYGKSILNAVQNGLRWKVKCLSYTDILKNVEQSAFKHGNYSGYTSVYTSIYDRLCEEALEFLNSEGEKSIPISLIARLIKCDILKMKAEDLRRREMKKTITEEKAEEVKRRFDPEYSQSATKKDVKISAKPEKSPKGGQIVGRAAQTMKRDTKLRRRGEEWMDIVYIDDAPDEGPDAYIMLMEFLDTDLLLELLQIGINLRYVVRINVNPPLIDTSILKHSRSGNERKTIIKRNITELRRIETINIATKSEDPDLYEVKKKLINRTKKVLKFWERLNDDLSELPTMLYYKDIGFVDFLVSDKPQYLIAAGDDLSAEIVLYDEISYFLYSLYKTFDNYVTYLKDMHVLDLQYKPDEPLQEMLVYERLTQAVPLECTDAATVLHCMLEQIEYSEEADHVTVLDYVTLVGANLTSKYEGIPNPVKDFLEDVLQSFDDSNSVGDIASLAEFPEPLVVIYGDEILRKNYHYKFEYVDSENVHLDFMRLLPPITLWDRYTTSANEDILNLRRHSNVLLSCMQNMSSHTLMFDNLYVYLFHMLCCHRRRDNMVSPSKLSNCRRRCLCREYPFAHQDIVDLLDYDDGFDEAAENHKDISFFDKYRFVEQMGTSILLQALQTAFYQFGKPAHFYCALSDAIVLAFSCLRDENGIKEASFAKSLAAPIGFRDFCSFIINEEWEPTLPEGHPSSSSSSGIQKSKTSSLTVTPFPYPDTEFLLKGSIKWQLWQDGLAAAEAEAIQNAKNLHASPSETERLRLSSMKNHEVEAGAHEEIPEVLTESELDVDYSGARFPGYPLGPHRVQFSSVAKECRLSDCCEVEVRLLERVYSRQWVSLRVQKAGHELFMHAPTWPPAAGEQAEKARRLGFFLRLRSGIIFSFKKTVTPAPFACRCAEVPFTMEVSWPCGLHIQLMPATDTSPSYVRQTYLVHHAGVRPAIADEKKRCFLADGHVLRFTDDDKVHVLCPDSSVFVCDVEVDVIPPSPHSSESKSSIPKTSIKKGKNAKMKKRASSKLSQVAAKSEPELPVVEHPPEVTGRITAYTSVDPEGRQWQWQLEGRERTEVLPRHLLRTYTDWEIHETFQRRGDDTNILTKADGTCIVSFPDDTRISRYVCENDTEVFCEWSTQELDQYYEWYAARNDKRFFRRALIPTGGLALLDEGYIYVRIRFRMEHPNYATVVAPGRDLPLELIMPEQTRVLVYPEGQFLVEVEDGVTLDVNSSSAVFAHADRCESELDFDGYNFTDDTRDWSRPLCRTVDYTGKRFDVNYMGDTECQVDPEAAVPTPRPYSDYRCLILNRDLSGRELIHEEVAEEWLSAALARPDEAVVEHQLSFAPHLSYHLSMIPMGENESERWLVPPLEARLTHAERRGVNRIPSTYGCPPSWFHPFPMRKGNNEEEVEEEEPEERVSNPDVLQVRLLTEVAASGARIIKAVEDALLRYLQGGEALIQRFSTVSDILLSYCSSDELVRQLQKSATRQNVLSRAHMRPRWQDKTSPAALELYRVVMARRGRLTAEEMGEATHRWVDQAACLAIALYRIRRRLRTAEENRRALRERVIPPYFRSHWGRAFTFTDDLTTRAVEEALGRQPSVSGSGGGSGGGSGSGSEDSMEARMAVSEIINKASQMM